MRTLELIKYETFTDCYIKTLINNQPGDKLSDQNHNISSHCIRKVQRLNGFGKIKQRYSTSVWNLS